LEQTKSLTWKAANSHSVEESGASFPHLGHLAIVRPHLIVSGAGDKITEETKQLTLSVFIWLVGAKLYPHLQV
jgi:hypothetical protein